MMGEALALASSWSRAAISASRPRLARSCRRSAKPPELPRPSMGGGSTAMTVPSDRLAKRWLKACTSSHDACPAPRTRSEEHTSELQSQSNLVCRLLLEKKKKKQQRYSD